jgi:hypothetical protein
LNILKEELFTQLSQICTYADDVTILAKTEKELKRIYQKLEEAVNKLAGPSGRAV